MSRNPILKFMKLKMSILWPL